MNNTLTTATELSHGDIFFLPNSDYKGTAPNVRYECVGFTDDGIYAKGLLVSNEGESFENTFFLPNFTQVEITTD